MCMNSTFRMKRKPLEEILLRIELWKQFQKKAIRVLVSMGAGSSSSGGPTKLFLFVQAPSSINLHQHFLPKRNFRYNKKIVLFKVRFSCRTKNLEREVCADDTHTAKAITSDTSNVDVIIWFQCRYIIKGLSSRASPTEE